MEAGCRKMYGNGLTKLHGEVAREFIFLYNINNYQKALDCCRY